MRQFKKQKRALNKLDKRIDALEAKMIKTGTK